MNYPLPKGKWVSPLNPLGFGFLPGGNRPENANPEGLLSQDT